MLIMKKTYVDARKKNQISIINIPYVNYTHNGPNNHDIYISKKMMQL